MIQQLVYISTVRGPTTPGLCEQILATSRRNNLRAGITGLLVAGGNRFLQLLEGETEKVRETYARIRSDERHFAAVVLAARMAERRHCPDWAMGYVQAGAAPDHGCLPAIVEALVAPIEDKALRAQFTGFAELHAAA